MMEGKKYLGKRSIKGATNDYFIFENWFDSNRSDKCAMNVGNGMVYMVKTNTRVLCMDTINNMKNYRPGVPHLALNSKSTVPKDRMLIYIGYKYNSRMVLSFVDT